MDVCVRRSRGGAIDVLLFLCRAPSLSSPPPFSPPPASLLPSLHHPRPSTEKKLECAAAFPMSTFSSDCAASVSALGLIVWLLEMPGLNVGGSAGACDGGSFCVRRFLRFAAACATTEGRLRAVLTVLDWMSAGGGRRVSASPSPMPRLCMPLAVGSGDDFEREMPPPLAGRRRRCCRRGDGCRGDAAASAEALARSRASPRTYSLKVSPRFPSELQKA
mmetsp:Transcript_3530/g.12666  ORF Transcript_3530/g.12666 Transcript_3530/m.12666 type:complete len:219 (-) Transcript_3530:301-957(-)